jgi:hypothetical protein
LVQHNTLYATVFIHSACDVDLPEDGDVSDHPPHFSARSDDCTASNASGDPSSISSDESEQNSFVPTVHTGAVVHAGVRARVWVQCAGMGVGAVCGHVRVSAGVGAVCGHVGTGAGVRVWACEHRVRA